MMINNFGQLLSEALKHKGKRVAVVYPNNTETLQAVYDACERTLARFILIGDQEIIERKIAEMGETRKPFEIVHRATVHEALNTAIYYVRDGKCDVLMKGGVDTSTMMKTVLHEDSGIRTGRLLSDIFILEFPQRIDNKFVMITDGGMTLAPDLKNKVELINNAVEVAHALGNPNPKVAVLSATEFVVPSLQSTLDAAALSKMNERGQIKGCIVDGPFALDNAVSAEAAAEKAIGSPVAGHAEILIAANIESANSLAKSTTYFAGLRLAHVIVGGKVPILIPSRADKSEAKMLSIALGVLMNAYYEQNPPG
ncbi:MAG: bifunctional enoyl-CoA hydratase/phosphate acetyltransferase [Bacteroidetes bacterium]|nr:bifunctional enoyl-CoA hydratase/phosphate acetyltransferase [Bacteroidota bacterium]MCW5894787.1 bifunctional enoyl-CoA hydratase/phosphate acetyltransferase [Bacteroidota bacterium]